MIELDETRNIAPLEGCGHCDVTDDEIPDTCGGCVHSEGLAEWLREGGKDLSQIDRETLERLLWQAVVRLTMAPGRKDSDEYDELAGLLKTDVKIQRDYAVVDHV